MKPAFFIRGMLALGLSGATNIAQSDEIASPVLVKGEAGDATLQTPVSFEAKQQPLRELLDELQKQTKVSLQISPQFTQTVRVTARVKDLSLSDVMGALGKIYQAQWVMDKPNQYLFTPLVLEEKEKALERIGDFRWYRFRDQYDASPDNSLIRGNELTQQIEREVSKNALRVPKGVPFSRLSAKTQDDLRRYFQETNGKDVIGNDMRALSVQNQNLQLRMEVPPEIKQQMKELPPGTIVVSTPIVRIYDESGNYLLEIPIQ